MPDDGLEYIKKLMKFADAADFDKIKDGHPHHDGTLYREVAAEYLRVLIERAHKVGCPEEEKHLTAVRNMTLKLHKEKLDIPWFMGSLIDSKLADTITDADDSKELLNWAKYHPTDKNCAAMDYTPPNLSSFKPKGGQNR